MALCILFPKNVWRVYIRKGVFIRINVVLLFVLLQVTLCITFCFYFLFLDMSLILLHA